MEKPINEQIIELIAQILTLESAGEEIRAEIRAKKKDINEKIKELGFEPKAFNKVLSDYRIQMNPAKKAEWWQRCEQVAKIQFALKQPSLFEYARKNGADWAK